MPIVVCAAAKKAGPAVADAEDAMDTSEYGDQFTFTETEASPVVKPQAGLDR